MHAAKLPAKSGFLWLKQGFLIWRRNPLALSMAATSQFFLPLLLAAIPYLGFVLPYIVAPALAVGMLRICTLAERGEPVQPSLLFSGFSRNLPRLLTLGGVLAVAFSLTKLSLSLLDDGALQAALTRTPEAGRPALAGNTELVLLALLAQVSVIYLCYWFAPALVGIRSMSPAKALFFSTLASLRNLAAFFVFALCLSAMALCVPMISFGLFASVPLLATIVFAVLVFSFVLPVVQAGIYVSQRSVFGDEILEDCEPN